MEQELAVAEPKSEVAVIFEKINSGLEAFESRKEDLTALKSKAEGLKIESIEDKQAINQVSTIRKELKKARVEIENEGKAMRDPLTKISKSISAKEQELVAIIEPSEKALLIQERWVKDEEERIEQEAARKEEERIQKRIDRLREYGHEIDLFYIKSITDEQFEKVVDNAKAEFEKEEALKAEQARKEQAQREQDEKDRAELKALREKQDVADKILRERQEELDRQETELKRKQEDQEREVRFQKREAEAALRRNRVDQLDNIGGNGQEYFARYDENIIVCEYDQLIALTEEEFVVIRDKHNAANAEANEKKRLAEQQRIEQARKEAVEKALADQKEREAEAARQEAERLSQASDKDKFATIITQIEALNYPEMKSAKHKKLLTEVKELQAKVIAHIKSKA